MTRRSLFVIIILLSCRPAYAAQGDCAAILRDYKPFDLADSIVLAKIVSSSAITQRTDIPPSIEANPYLHGIVELDVKRSWKLAGRDIPKYVITNSVGLPQNITFLLFLNRADTPTNGNSQDTYYRLTHCAPYLAIYSPEPTDLSFITDLLSHADTRSHGN